MAEKDRFYVLVTNDDGPFSPGLWLLYDSIEELADVEIVVPETPKSASGLGITLHKPLRVSRIEIGGKQITTINGTPSDIVYVATSLKRRSFDLVISGVNIGDNTSIQVILSSGTIGAAIQAALLGLPAIAFSAEVRDPTQLEEPDMRYMIMSFAKKIVRRVLSKGLPRGVDILNVNFPSIPTNEVEVAAPAIRRFENKLVKRKDPRGLEYYWLYGLPVSPEEGTDVHSLLVKKRITITPISLRSLLNVRELIDTVRHELLEN